MISDITGAEQLIDDEGGTEVLVTVKNLPVSSVLQPKKKKLKNGIFYREWLKIAEYQRFLKEYKSYSSQATCIVCNQQFSIHDCSKNDIDNHMKTQKHQNN
jgi:hypothetical protein